MTIARDRDTLAKACPVSFPVAEIRGKVIIVRNKGRVTGVQFSPEAQRMSKSALSKKDRLRKQSVCPLYLSNSAIPLSL